MRSDLIRHLKTLHFMKSLKFCMLIFCLTLLGLHHMKQKPIPDVAEKVPALADAVKAEKEPIADRSSEREAFSVSVHEELVRYRERNRRAHLRASKVLWVILTAQQENTPAFVADVMRFQVQMRMMRGSLSDGWDRVRGRRHQADRVERQIRDQFEAHYFSDLEMRAILQVVLRDYVMALRGSRNQLYAAVGVEMRRQTMEQDGLNEEVLRRLQVEVSSKSLEKIGRDLNRRQTLRTVAGLADAGWVMGKTGAAMSAGFLTRAGVGTASKSIAVAGAAAKGGAAGGAVGTKAGPLGTLGGVVVGITVGVVVDRWMEKEIRENLTHEVNDFLCRYRTELVFGGGRASDGWFYFSGTVLSDMERMDFEVLQEAKSLSGAPVRQDAGLSLYAGLTPSDARRLRNRFERFSHR